MNLDNYYLVVVGYTNRERFLASYKRIHNHLSEQREECQPYNNEEYFTMKYAFTKKKNDRKMVWIA